MPQRKKLERMALLGLVIQLVFVAIYFALYSQSDQSPAVLAQLWFVVPGVAVWLVVLLHGRQRRLAREESEEMEKLQKARLSEEIFEEQELDEMRAHTALKIFEKYVAPVFSVILAVFLGVLAYINLAGLWGTGVEVAASNPLGVVVGAAVVSFFGFLFGKYVVGLAHGRQLRLLRAGGSYMMGNVLGSLIVLVAMSMVHFGVMWLEVVAAYVIPLIMGLISVEIVVNQILEFYRPRVPGQESRPAYDSRLLNLVAEPGDILETVAATLDYQFGFKISETWFYRFMERAIVPLICIQLALLWLLSCIVVVDRGEGAFIERFGSPLVQEKDAQEGLQATLYRPGYHLKLPWPIDAVRRVSADRVFATQIGKEPVAEDLRRRPEERDASTMTDEDVILWQELHVMDPSVMEEVAFLVPSVVDIEDEIGAPSLNIARLEGDVHFRIKRDQEGRVDPEAAFKYHYGYTDPQRIVKDVAYRTLCRIAASQNFLRWIHRDRGKVSREFERRMQVSLDNRDMGVELVYAGIPAVHPPAETADAYESVISAYEKEQTMISEAEKDAVQRVGKARGRSAEVVAEAEGYRYRLEKVSEAEKDRFDIQLDAYLRAPEVYRYRKYFTAVEDVLGGHKLLIVPINEKEVNIIDMQEKRGTDLLDIGMEEALQ
ncbi:MAG: SPFH domain-containing protein [Candidatus Brocadiia bacterium]